jgi:hypothetical protein
MGGKSITWAIGRGGRENRDFLGHEMAFSAICSQKSRDFQGPPLPMAPLSPSNGFMNVREKERPVDLTEHGSDRQCGMYILFFHKSVAAIE